MLPDFCEFERVGKTLLGSKWIFAKTMPENPHWYTLRKDWGDDRLFDEVVIFMRKYGYREIYKGRPYTMLNVNNMKYWTMGAPLASTILINRKPHDMQTDYDQIAGMYDRLFGDEESLSENTEIMDRLGTLSGDVLDIGCGTGLLLDYKQPENYTGLDPSLKMLRCLLRKHPEYNPHVIHTRFEDFVGERYEVIVSLFGAVNYIGPAYLSRIPQLLKPEGRYFVMFFKPDYIPVTYTRAGIVFEHYQDAYKMLPGNVTEFNEFLIVEGKG